MAKKGLEAVNEGPRLTQADADKLRILNLDKQLHNMKIALAVKQTQLYQTEQKWLQSQIELKSVAISQLGQETKTLQEKVAKLGEKETELGKEIGARIGFPDGKFGYNVDTLEVIADPKAKS